uniref:Reverse transcriptase domain-containing protein n=2 Tax=Amphimedon queenslandica TaxID=400682 RepID=A0A1X7TNS1_AMPQE
MSPSLPPIPGKVIDNVRAGLFVDLKEMIPDNAALTKQILETESNAGSKLRELKDPLSWAFYFLDFLAISVPDKGAEKLAAYGQIVIPLAQKHGGGAGSPMTDCSLRRFPPNCRVGACPLVCARQGICSIFKERDNPGFRIGITQGFRIGVPPCSKLVPYSSNWPSAVTLAEKFKEYLDGKIRAGSLYPSVAANVHLSPVGFITKKNRPLKFRLIVDLSSPRGGSVNDANSPAHALFSYITVRRVAELIPEGMLLAKLDMKAAYRQVPVHPEDQLLLGIKWRGTVFCDRALPFGLRDRSVKRELRLLWEKKLLRLQRLLREWVGKKATTKHDLQVIIDLLNDAAQVVPAGRPFLRNLIDAMSPLRKAHYFSRLNLGFRADRAWWCCFMERWNGVGLFHVLPLGPSITADASGSWGAGAFLAPGKAWFQIKWPAAGYQ